MSQAPITIYVGAGNLDAPHYSFFLDEDGSNELTNFTLDANYTYTFKRLADAASHPFFIREKGSEEVLSDQVIINGDGDLINGITGDQSFTLSFADPSIAESLSLEFYCTSHAEMVQTIEIENIQARSIPAINSSKYISGNGEFTLDGLRLGNLNSSEEIGISEILVANETGEPHILKPEYVKQKITRGLSGSRASGRFSGFIKEDGSAVIFNDEDKSYVLEGDAVDIYGNTYLLAVEQRDGTVKTLIKDGNGNLRHHATLTPDNSDAEITSISLSRNSLINTYSDGTIKWNNQTWIVGTPPNSVLNGENIVKIIPHGSHHIALHNDGTLTRWGNRVTEQKTLPNIPDLDGSDESRTVVDIGNQGGLWIKLEDNSFIYYPGFLGVDNFSSQYNGNWFDDSNQLIPFLDHPANANYDWNGPNDDLFVSRTWAVHHNGGSGLLVERSDGFLVEYSPRGTTDRVISSDWGNDDKGDPVSLVDVYHGFIFHLSDGSIRNSRTGDIYYQPTSENDPQPVDVAGIYKRSILLDDGTIVGNNPYPGDIDGPNDDLTVQKIIWTGGYNGDNNTAALRSDGSVITWGSRSNLLIENASESIASSLQSGIKDIFIGGLGAWYAIDSNNQVIPWGHSGSIDNSILTNLSDYPYYTADQSKRNQIKHHEAGTNLIAGLSSDDQSKLSNGQWTVISTSLYSQHGDEFEYGAGTDFVDTTDNFLERTFFKPLDRTELDLAIEAWINDEATAIQTYGDINEWDVSNIIDFSGLFDGERDFNSDISDWDVSNGTDFSGMFRHARAFNQDIGDWDLSKGENLGTMFEGARSFNQDIGGWDVGQASSMFNMFNYTNFNQDIGEWDVGNVVNFAGMFQVSMFDQDIGNWDVSSGNYFEYMFHRAPFDQDISDWKFGDSFSLRDMFSYSKFNQDISGWDVSDARSFGQMFQGNKEFDRDLRTWNVPDDASLLRMFAGADKMLVKGWLETPESSNFAPAPPSFSSLDEASIIEKSANNHVIYQALADHWTDVKYSLSGDNSDLFDIDEISGKVRFLGNAKYDDNKPENNEKSFIVRVTDQYGDFTEKTVDFIIEDSSLAFWKDSGYRVDAAAFKDGSPSVNAVTLKDRYNRVLSDEISRSWNGLSVIKSNDGYRMLQVAERGRRRGQYRIAELNSDGVLQSVGAWVDEDQAVADRYQELFELDLNNDGQIAIPAAVDVDLDGFADGLGHYRLMGNGMSVDLSDDRGSTISAKTSRNWNAVVSKQVDDGFQVVIQGERGRRRSQFQVWSTDVNGMVIDKSSWLDGAALASQGYEQTFNRDFNNDSYVGVPAITSSSDANGDGFVDGLGHYMLMGLSSSSAVDFIDNRGRRLTPQSSRSWNALSAAPNPDDPSSGFEVLIQGERGRRRSQYQVWSTDANGQVTSKSSWLDAKTLAQQGYETTFAKDFNGDALIGVPSGSSLVDQDSNGLVDGITHYALLQGSGNTAQSIDLKDRRGRVLSDTSSRSWNVIHAHDNGNGFDVLVQGERGRRRSQYLLWKADQIGLITDKSRWQTGDQLAFDGYESVFGLDLNDNGTIGL